MLLVAALFMLGIFVSHLAPVWPIVWMLASAVGLIGAIRFHARRPRVSSILIAINFLLAGLLVAQLEAFYYAPPDIGQFATDTPRLAQLELFINHEPRVLTDLFSDRPMPPRQVVTAHVSKIKTWNGWIDATGEILVQIVQPHPQLALDQHVRVLGLLERPAPASNPGQFDWAAYYREQRILTSIHIPTANNITILSQDSIGPLDWIRVMSRRWLAMGFPATRSLDHALLRALLLGDSDPELRDVQEQFRRTGTSHHLSISGMHVAVLGGFVLLLCRLLKLHPRTATIIALAFTLVYGVAALPSPPVVRSILLCFFFGIGLITRRSLDALNLLALSVFAMLVWHPLDLFNAGFQLSFGTVLGLILFATMFLHWLERLRHDDPALPPFTSTNVNKYDSPAMIAIRRGSRFAESWLLAAFATGLVAWTVSFPLIAFHFEQLNWWAIPAGIVLAPIVFAALIGGLLKVVATALFPSLAATFAYIAAVPIRWMQVTVQWLARLPFADYPVPRWPLWWLLVIYAAYLLWLVPWRRPKLSLVLRLVPVAVIVLALALPVRAVERATADEELRLTILSVGAGQSAVLETPSGRTIMIDAGSMSLSDPLRKCIAPFLRTRGCTSIDSILLTHGDYDHINAVAAIAPIYGVREVLIGNRFRAEAADNPTAEAMLKTLDALDIPPRAVSPGEQIPLGRGVAAEALWPPVDRETYTTNDSAMVVRIRYAGRTILVPGDVQEVAERGLMQQYGSALHADVLIAPHHGSSELTTAAFVRAVNPSVIVSSNDRTLSGKQKRFESMIGHRPLYRTNTCGAITIHIKSDGALSVETFLKH